MCGFASRVSVTCAAFCGGADPDEGVPEYMRGRATVDDELEDNMVRARARRVLSRSNR